MLQGLRDHGWLFRDFFGHEVFVTGFVHPRAVDLDGFDGAIGQRAVFIPNFHRLAGDHGAVAFGQIGDLVGQRGKRDGVGAYEHFAVSVPDGQRRAFAGDDQQVVFTVKQEGEREGTVQFVERFVRGFNGRCTFVDEVMGQEGHGFSVCFRLRCDPVFRKFCPQLAEVFDDAVVYDSHRTRLVRVCVFNRRATVGCPAGVADASFTGERFVHQQIRQIDQLAHSAAAVERAVIDGGNTGTVVATVFKPFERLNQDGSRFVIS